MDRDYTVVENEGDVEVCVEITDGSLQRDVIVTLETRDGSAEGILATVSFHLTGL